MAIRWNDFPHGEIRLRIYASLGHNALERSANDSLRHVLQRKLSYLNAEDHRRFVELEASCLVEHLRCTRDIYQEFVNDHKCRPVVEAHWMVLRFAVFPTAIELLKERVTEYAKLTRIPGRDLSLLYGIPSRACGKDSGDALRPSCLPDLDDNRHATEAELRSLGHLVDEDSLLCFKDIKDGGSVFQLFGGGPFATDDRRSLRNSWSLCGLSQQITLLDWATIREKLWHLLSPWTDGLVNLFAAVQEELLTQWRALPPDSLAYELGLKERGSRFEFFVVPSSENTRKGMKPGRKPRLAEDFVVCAGTLWRKTIRDSNTKVSHQQLREIARALDFAGHLEPARYLEGKYAEQVKSFNSRHSNSKIGPLRTWSRLVSHGDKDHLQGMRRLLSRCAAKASDDCPASGINSGQKTSS
jgi:hypothetical protein